MDAVAPQSTSTQSCWLLAQKRLPKPRRWSPRNTTTWCLSTQQSWKAANPSYAWSICQTEASKTRTFRQPSAVAEAVRIMEDACRASNTSTCVEFFIAISNRPTSSSHRQAASRSATSACPAQSPLPPERRESGIPATYHLKMPRRGPESAAGDVYTAGVTAYRLLNGDHALRGIVTPGSDPMDLIAKGRYPNRKFWLPHTHDRLRKVVNQAMNVDPNKRYVDARSFRRALEQARPQVSWWPTSPATGLGWEGISSDGTTWRAVVEPKVKSGFRFTVERRLLGKAWRKKPADAFEATTEAEALAHAHIVLSQMQLTVLSFSRIAAPRCSVGQPASTGRWLGQRVDCAPPSSSGM